MKIEDLSSELDNRVILKFEDGEMSYSVSDEVMLEIVELLSKHQAWVPLGAFKDLKPPK
jgi:hypothetical protein